MSTKSYLQVGGIEVLVVRKPIKNLHLSILPPVGRVRVTSPEKIKDEAIRTLLASRLSWIKRQQSTFANQERQTKRNYVSGESHYFFGKRYRLEVMCKRETPTVTLKGKNKIILLVRPKSTILKRREILTEWYRERLYPVVHELMLKWSKKMGVKVNSWGIKQMKTRWGTCNQKTARILINLELAKKPIFCVEYIIVHELVHLIEKKHDQRFVALLTKHLPKWRSAKEELNRFILSYEEWGE